MTTTSRYGQGTRRRLVMQFQDGVSQIITRCVPQRRVDRLGAVKFEPEDYPTGSEVAKSVVDVRGRFKACAIKGESPRETTAFVSAACCALMAISVMRQASCRLSGGGPSPAATARTG